ncbi:MAG: Hsp20/alpha crystallin family protein [Actinobacteria bacterium]|nr:Hsp20/alpha crystallin family protein [Actinomycetota bacterium]
MAVLARRWDPLRDLLTIQGEMNRLLGDSLSGEGDSMSGWAPAIDLYQTPEKFSIVAELPGMTTGDVEILVEDQVLTLRGERKFYSDVSEDNFHRVERRYGTFMRRITLPAQCDASKIEASMNNGLLTIDVPKAEQAKPKRIEVKAVQS